MKLEITYENNFGEWEETITISDGKAEKSAYHHLRTDDIAALERLSRLEDLDWVQLSREARRWARQWSGPVEVRKNGQKMPEEYLRLRQPPAEAVNAGDKRIPSSGLVDSITATQLFCDYGLGNKSEFSYFQAVV